MAPLPPSVFLLVTGFEDSRRSGSRDSSSSRDGSPSHLWSSSWSLGECQCRCSQRHAHWTYGERGRRGTPAPPADEDDGSGMGWVKRRCEECEGKKLEEQSAREAASKTNVVPISSPASTVLSVDHNVTTITHSQPTPENDDDEEEEEETKYDSLDDKSSGTEQDDDDDDAEEQHFKQVLGAGVERVSRHRTLTAQKLHDDGDDMKHGANDGDERAARQQRLW
ncbi:hypothetical protein EDB85DRAFT_2156572 [Lactarius pseudohatsudake]|nr:hypothetical protein EDB85DRAFT_2156572 [Lactarius pseudohatsudake]